MYKVNFVSCQSQGKDPGNEVGFMCTLRVQHTVHKLRGKTSAPTERGKKKSNLT